MKKPLNTPKSKSNNNGNDTNFRQRHNYLKSKIIKCVVQMKEQRNISYLKVSYQKHNQKLIHWKSLLRMSIYKGNNHTYNH